MLFIYLFILQTQSPYPMNSIRTPFVQKILGHFKYISMKPLARNYENIFTRLPLY